MLYRSVETTATAVDFASIPGLELTEMISSALTKDGITVPTEAQQLAFAPILQGRNSVIESGTGTGKTLAYLLPILQKLRHDPQSRAVCFAPATELAVQTLRVCERYKDPAIATAALVAMGNQRAQAIRLQKSTRIIVGTVARILEMYQRRKLKGVNIVVLDEPEPLLASRESDYLREVLSRPDPKLQLVLVGATFGANSERFISDIMGSEVVRTVAKSDPLRNLIAHQSIRARNDGEKDHLLARFIEQQRCARAIVFVNQPNLVRHLFRYLNEQNIPTASLSHERSKLQCEQAIREFAIGKVTVLLTTDRAATGLDVPGVDWVLHFELPNSAKAYVHRAGRTGRAGRAGSSVIFFSAAEIAALRKLENGLGLTFSPSER